MRYRRLPILLSLLALLSIVCTCPLGSLPGGLVAVSGEERAATLADAAQFRLSLSGVDLEADKAALADHLKSLAGIEAAGVADDGSVWGRFRDGRLLIFMYGPEPGSGPAGRSPVLESPGLTYLAEYSLKTSSGGASHDNRIVAQVMGTGIVGQSSGIPEGLPESRKAYVEWSFSANERPTGLEPVRVARWLSGNGYEVRPSEPTVEGLRQVVDAGVFVLNTHGGMGESVKVGADGHALWTYGLVTTSPYTMAHDDDYQEDLDSGRLVYANIAPWETPDWYYAITGDFVRHYMSFSRSSFVYAGACGSYNDDMRSAFMRSLGGAAAYAGWTLPTRSDCGARAEGALFNLLLGLNEEVSAKPPIRPFDVASAVEYLAEKGLNPCEDPELGTSWLKVDVSANANVQFGLLAPSIRTMDVILEDQKEMLVLHGIFGEDPGKDNRSITIGGVKVDEVKTWKWNEIHVPLLPADKPGGSGDVVVTVREHKSNAVPLTLWHGEFRYKVENLMGLPGMGGTQQTITFDVYIRADIHSYRDIPSAEPIPPQEVEYVLSEPSKATMAFEGAEDMGCTFSVSGEAEMRLWQPERGAEPESHFNGWGAINARDHTMTLRMGMSLPKVGEVEISCPPPIGTVSFGDYSGALLDVMNETQTLTLGDDWGIVDGNQTANTAAGFVVPMDATLEWDAIPAKSGPTEDTQG